MSVREEDRKKNSCPSRGLGIAAAAIGVGVGAALYYFFNKRQENSNSEGSSSDWNCERPQPFHLSDSDSSYTTISENDTTDTSMNSSHGNLECTVESIPNEESNSDESHYDSDSHSDSDSSSESGLQSNIITHDDYLDDSTFEYLSLHNALSSGVASDSENIDWDITTSSSGMPEDRARSPMSMLLHSLANFISPRERKREQERININRQRAFRERSWTLEECSICFDVMLRNQEVTTLPCTHNFHTECIMPWLQEKQTCPVCRKAAE